MPEAPPTTSPTFPLNPSVLVIRGFYGGPAASASPRGPAGGARILHAEDTNETHCSYGHHGTGALCRGRASSGCTPGGSAAGATRFASSSASGGSTEDRTSHARHEGRHHGVH